MKNVTVSQLIDYLQQFEGDEWVVWDENDVEEPGHNFVALSFALRELQEANE